VAERKVGSEPAKNVTEKAQIQNICPLSTSLFAWKASLNPFRSPEESGAGLHQTIRVGRCIMYRTPAASQGPCPRAAFLVASVGDPQRSLRFLVNRLWTLRAAGVPPVVAEFP